MGKIHRLAPVALLAAATLATQVVPVRGHDDGLTCHAHPTGGWSAGFAFVEMGSPVRLGGSIRIDVDDKGAWRVGARGAVTLHDDFAHDWAVLTIDDGGATMACSDAGMTSFYLPLRSPRSDERGSLSIVPPRPIREPGRHAVRVRLEHPDGVIEYDGAILVVSAADGPMP